MQVNRTQKTRPRGDAPDRDRRDAADPVALVRESAVAPVAPAERDIDQVLARAQLLRNLQFENRDAMRVELQPGRFTVKSRTWAIVPFPWGTTTTQAYPDAESVLAKPPMWFRLLVAKSP